MRQPKRHAARATGTSRGRSELRDVRMDLRAAFAPSFPAHCGKLLAGSDRVVVRWDGSRGFPSKSFGGVVTNVGAIMSKEVLFAMKDEDACSVSTMVNLGST